MSAAFLLVGVGIGAYFLIRPVGRFIAGETTFAEIEASPLTSLPRRSAILVGFFYAPMVALRLLSPQFDITFGAMLEDPWPGPTSSPPSWSAPASTSC